MITKYISTHIIHYVPSIAKQVAVASRSLLFVTTVPHIIVDVGHRCYCWHRDVGVSNCKIWKGTLSLEVSTVDLFWGSMGTLGFAFGNPLFPFRSTGKPSTSITQRIVAFLVATQDGISHAVGRRYLQ
ncbi:hypothetical protein FGSG_13365 [Fusarium graminearum PH-1]|uniref:hypothetical protein n=1 Tax=Gibberella zeae (strain ATCC MYA-4620 / CBS 123657 / FGSC 9075 / NRRL 31084 / PH-1) TaxID=229533 RepID=UPI00021F1E83|nr:hypothetical protein FGSG_13365 [Fusarium graminearum PH-1]ESU14907.1 hypothetical protein FGSG_13365 [Fusarium graminearum PH-1]|eukprot:XP_011320332.1 hypothetical protein FGSG_13365 [Fusarium graminearum PH-1]